MSIFFKNSFLFIFLTVYVSISSCDNNASHKGEQDNPVEDNFIKIVTTSMEFQTVDTIKSGWHTFRYVNKSHETHFFLLDKYPKGKTMKDGEHEVAPVFQKGMDLINEGMSEEGYAEFNKLPEWFFGVVFSGGSGLISPGEVAETTLKIEPGYYVIECYVKMANGMFHSTMGMVKELIVTEDSVDNIPPIPDVKISISSTEGITFNNPVAAGKQTFSVHFKDQIVHENFVGHDIHLVKLDDHADIDLLEKWMNWADPKGLITPSPEGVTFLGGVNDMPAGSTGYFSAELLPGKYAFISEVPSTRSKNMLKLFEITVQ